MSSKTILIIDDNETIRQAYAAYLTDAGYSTSQAKDGSDALASLASGALPSLILLDLEMPKMNGVQFLERQKRDPRLAVIPVILNSGLFTLPDIAISHGVDYIQKPCMLHEILNKIENVLSSP